MSTKIVLIMITTLLGFVNAFSQNAIEVRISNIREARGNILVAIFDKESDFLEKAVQSRMVAAANGNVKVLFENIPPGEYAVSIIHDENSNGELDTNLMGLPKEGFAFGNNAMGTFGPPSFEKAKVNVKEKKVVQELVLKYL